MSKTIDERVVEMRFDNSHFEKNTKQTMSTLDKLKQKLNLTGASKGLENINASANKVNMSGMTKALDTVHSKFSALEVMGVTALANITNSAVNAGKRMVKALTIDPITSGLSEYETQINAIQTILSNTRSEGTNVEIVNEALDELNEYADKTIYNFTEMTRNIGTFTAAGVKLDTSVSAIKGIANLAAVSGSTSQQASTAMYQLSQALAAGRVSLMDWNSVVNAGMGGKVFQDALIRTSELLGTGAKQAIDTYGSFRESLTKGEWLTTEVLTETLNQLSGAYSEADLIAQGFTEEQAKEIKALADDAESAATKVKTFTQLWDVLKESAQSGWAQTWRLIVGDFEQAKNLFSPLAEFLTGIIGKISDARNALLEGALGKSFKNLKKTLDTITDPIKKTVNGVKQAGKALEDMGKIVNKVIRGDFGNGKERLDKLTKAGYNYYAIQNKVNEKLGSSFRYSKELTGAQEDLNKAQEKGSESSDKLRRSLELAGSESEFLEQLAKMSDEELRLLGIEEDQIEALKELRKYSNMTGLSIKEFVDNIDEIDGRWLLINSFKNAGQGLVAVITAIKDAWVETIGVMKPDTLFNIIAGIHKFSTYLKVSDEAAKNLKDTFKGVFSILDIILTLIGGPIKIGIKLLMQLFKALDIFDGGILEITGSIGRAITWFHDWLEEILDFTAIFEFLAPIIKSVAMVIKNWFKSIGNSEPVVKFTEYLIKSKEAIVEWLNGFREMSPEDIVNFFRSIGRAIKEFFLNINDNLGGIPGDIISGLANGLKSGANKALEGIIFLATSLIDTFKNLLGIHSPSKVFFAIGGFIIAGLIGGLLAGQTDLGSALGNIVSKITEFFGNIDWNKIFSAGMSAGLLLMANKLSNIVENITAPLGGVGDVLESVSGVINKSAKGIAKTIENAAKVVKSFSKVLNGFAFKTRMEGIKELAWSLLILVGAIAILTLLDTDKMWEGVKVILALSVILAILAVAMNKISQASITVTRQGVQATGMKASLISIGIALLAMAGVVKMLGGMNPDQIKQGFLGLAGAVIALVVLLKAFGKFIDYKNADNINEAGKMIKKIGTALLIMAIVAKIVGGMEWTELGKAAAFVGGFLIFVALLTTISMIPGKNIDALGGTLLKISAAMLLMAFVVKTVSKFGLNELRNGLIFAGSFLAFVAILLAATMIPGGKVEKLGSMLLGISAAMLIMVGVVKLIGGMKWQEALQGGIGVAVLGGIIYGLLYMVNELGPDVPKLAGTLLAMAAAIGILGIVVFALGILDVNTLIQGLTAVGILSLFMAMLIETMKSLKDVNDVKGIFIGMAVAIAVMAASLVALSFIDWTKLLPATIAMAALMGMFALMIKATKDANGAIGPLIVMTVAVGVLGTLLILLAKLAPDGAIKAAVSLSLLMGVLTLLLLSIDKMRSNVKDVAKVAANLLILCVPLLALAGILYLLKDTNNSIKSVLALTILMGAMTGLMVLMSKIKPSVSNAVKGAIGLLALCVPLVALAGILILMNFANGNVLTNVAALTIMLAAMTGVLTVLSFIGAMVGNAIAGAVGLLALCVPLVAIAGILILMNLTDNVMTNVLALSAMLAVMTGVLVVLSIVGSLVGSALLGALGLLALCVPLVAMAGILILMNNCENAMENAKALSLLLVTMAGVLTILGIVGPLALIGTVALGALVIVIGAIGAFAVAIGALMQKFPQLQSFLDTGLPVLIQLAGAIGEMIGAFVSGVLTQISAGLPEIGMNLSLFMMNLLPFITGIKMVDDQVLKGVGIISAAILALTGAQLLEGIVSFLTGGTSFADLGTQLSQFMINTMPFIMLSKMIDPAIMEGIKTLAEAFMIITGGQLLEGIFKFVSGKSSLETFAAQLPILGAGLNGFVTSLGPVTPEQVTAAQNAAQIIKTLAEAANAVPNTGGLLADLIGDNNLSMFAAQLPVVAVGIASFIKTLQNNSISTEAATTANTAADIIKTLAGAAKEIPNIGGKLADLIGDNDLSKFAGGLPDVATGITGFINKLSEGGVTEKSAEVANTAAKIIKTLAEAADVVPNTGGKLAELIGDNDLSKFADNLPDVGIGVAGFANELGEFKDDKLATVQAGVGAVQAIADLGSIDFKKFGNYLPNFGEKIISFGSKIKEFINTLNTDVTGESINLAVTKIFTLVDMAKTVATENIDNLKTFGDSLKTFAKDGIKGFVEEFKNDDTVTNAKEAAKAMVQGVIDGAEEKKDGVKTKFEEVAQEAITGLNNEEFKTSATSAGKDLVQGLINGLTNKDKRQEVWNAAYSLGQLAVKAEKEGQQSNSPSKATEKAGKWLGEGLIIGIQRMNGSVYNAGKSMGEEATNSISGALDTVMKLINTDMDTEPTIRPVLDLSDVKSGVGYLSSMFSNGPSLAVASNLGAISFGMDSRNQNGVNDDVVSAIDDLRKDLGNIGGNTYNVNGITYDDGSNITEAVKALIRAAKVERRT